MSKLTREEREILQSYKRGEWKSLPDYRTEAKKIRKAATATVRAQRIHIQLSAKDLKAIQKRAAEEGMPCEVLIARIVHKYASGRLVDKT
jgi:predicted DNA binding CopG/RHH family protein